MPRLAAEDRAATTSCARAESLLQTHAARATELRRLLGILDSSLHGFDGDSWPIAEACVALAAHAARRCGLGSVPAAMLEVSDLPKHAATPSLDLHDAELWDDALGLLACSVSGLNRRGIVEAGRAVAAATRYLLLPDFRRDAIMDAMEVALAGGGGFREARRAALASARRATNAEDLVAGMAESGAALESVAHESVAADDDRVREALYGCLVAAIARPALNPLGFPASKVGLRTLVAAARAGPRRSQRAAAVLGRWWHASDAPGPLWVSEGGRSAMTPWGPTEPPPPPREGVTLVVAFSSLGWDGLVRAEWGATLSSMVAEGRVVAAHALDTAMSWFTTNPTTGEADDGVWWERALGRLCEGYGRVCLLGDSMGGSAALRFARHATSNGAVVALVPQLDLRDPPVRCDRRVFTDERCVALREAIGRACAKAAARSARGAGLDPRTSRCCLAPTPPSRLSLSLTASEIVGSRLALASHCAHWRLTSGRAAGELPARRLAARGDEAP